MGQLMSVSVSLALQGTFQDFTGHSDLVRCLTFSPSGGMLASAAHTDIVCWEVCV
jgi:hypothetical protein